MPLIHVTAAQGTIGKTEQGTLIKRLSNAVLKAERAPIEDAGAQALAWAHYHEQPVGTSYAGGAPIEERPLRIAITTPEGALTSTTRQELAAAVSEIVDDIVGPFEARLNHWTMFYNVGEGSWAGGGQIFPLASIQAAMNVKSAHVS